MLTRIDRRHFTTALEFAAVITALQAVAELNEKYFEPTAPAPVLYIVNEAEYSAHLTMATLFQEKLTDGSFVYFIRLEA